MDENRYQLERIRSQIKPLRLQWQTRLRSTNDHAARLRKRGELFAPAVVLCGRQIAGRGRGAHTWWSGPGSMTATFVLPVDEMLLPHQVPLIAGVAVRTAAAQLCEESEIQLKWPNDLLFQGRKLAGLLCERVGKADLIGVGLNINLGPGAPKDLRSRMIWMSEIAGRTLDKSQVLIEVARQLHTMLTRLREHPFAGILREYDRHHALTSRKLTVTMSDSPAVTGVCQGLDSMGRLLLRSNGQTTRIIAGQVDMH